MADLWFSELESKLFTRIKYELTTKPEAPFPQLNCTTVSNSDTPTKFPTLYFHELEPVERGADLEGKTVNAVMETIEMQVYSNQSEKECKEIISEAIGIMKDLSFGITMFPNPQTRNKISFAIARCRRMIAHGDYDITNRKPQQQTGE